MNIALPDMYDHQIDFLECNRRYVLFMGGRGSGKSFVSPYKGFMYAIEHPKSTCLMLAPVHKQAKEIVFNPLQGILSQLPIGFYSKKGSDSGAEFRLWNGSRILTGNLSNFGYYKSYNIDYISIDEFQEVADRYQEESLSEATLLLRSRYGYNEQLVITCNPTGMNSPLHKFFVENSSENTWFRSFSSYENESLSNEYMTTLESLPKLVREGYLLGHWLEHEGAIYSVRDNHIVDSPLSQESKWYLSFDWGYYPDPFVCLLIQEHNGNIHVKDEITKTKMTHPMLLPMVRRMLNDHGVRSLDGLCGDTAEPKSIRWWAVNLADYSPSKKQVLELGVLKERKNGALAVMEKLESLNEHGIPYLTFSSIVKGTIESVRSMTWDIHGEPDDTNPKDHEWDALRYYTMSAAYIHKVMLLKI